jgi:hypothetical protein
VCLVPYGFMCAALLLCVFGAVWVYVCSLIAVCVWCRMGF